MNLLPLLEHVIDEVPATWTKSCVKQGLENLFKAQPVDKLPWEGRLPDASTVNWLKEDLKEQQILEEAES